VALPGEKASFHPIPAQEKRGEKGNTQARTGLEKRRHTDEAHHLPLTGKKDKRQPFRTARERDRTLQTNPAKMGTKSSILSEKKGGREVTISNSSFREGKSSGAKKRKKKR